MLTPTVQTRRIVVPKRRANLPQGGPAASSSSIPLAPPLVVPAFNFGALPLTAPSPMGNAAQRADASKEAPKRSRADYEAEGDEDSERDDMDLADEADAEEHSDADDEADDEAGSEGHGNSDEEGDSDDEGESGDEDEADPRPIKRARAGGWTKAKLDRYQAHLIRRGTRRGTRRADNNKPVNMLVRKYVNARRLAEPGFDMLTLADAPVSGHHVPSISLGNARGNGMDWGPRGSAGEKAQSRLFFRGTPAERANAHGIAHMAETFAGLGSRNAPNFVGDDQAFATTHRRAHYGLQYNDRTPIHVDVQSQTGRANGEGVDAANLPIGDATRRLMAGRGVPDEDIDFAAETTDSEPESDEEEWYTDSDDDRDDDD